MTMIKEIADKFFSACDAGVGWDICKAYCTPNASVSAQAEPLIDMTTLQEYVEWTKDLMQVLPDGHYDLVSFASDEIRRTVMVYAVFHGTHTGKGGPVPPTGRSVRSDYVYVMQFEGDKICHLTKIWHSGLAMKELGWA